MNTSTKKNKISRAATLLLFVLLSAANTLAQAPWQGSGTEQDPYRINNTGDLETLAQQVNSGTTYEGQFFRLNADLTYNTATQNNHTAIGTYTRSFKGTFDGNNHTISGIRISRNSGCQGLFGHCENSTVKNLILTDTQISGNYSIGGIVGYSVYGSSIENCHVANNVTVSGSYEIGGIVGLSFGDCSIADCQVANITINSVDGVGTIVGYYYNTTFHRNYYLGCTVNGVANATDVGTPHGDITENDGAVPGYAIHTAADWDFFCDALQDNATYNHFIGLTVWLTADIEITRIAGSGYHDFMGTFDGQGHTLTVAYGSAGSPITEEYFAPFRNLENGAVIRNLHVGGHIYTSNRFASGIVGCQWGTVSISNCRSSVIIYSSKIGDGTHGGIVADQHGTLTVNGCVFDGLLLTTNGTTLCSGLVGYHNDGTCTISDCLYAPSEANLPWGLTYITDGATFCRNYSGTPANCYYTETLGEVQGKLAHSITSEDVTPVFAGEVTEYDVSGITTCGTGLQYGNMLYASNEDQVSLNLVAHDGFSAVAATYTPEGGTATEITFADGVYSFTMPDADVVINAVTEYIIHDATEWNNFCDALEDNDTYNHFIGKTVRLANDITVTRMAGSSTHDFMGTFDGQGHTLTLAYGNAENPITEEYAAPFHNVENGCVIENLHVDGTITTANKYAAGIVAQQYGAVTIRNCRSSVTIQSSVEGDGTHGGLVGVKGNSNNANLTIEGCTFDGKIVSTGTTATTLCGGFVGWRSNSGSLTITNSLYAPTADNNAVTSGATFARNWTMPDDANCYYTETLGAAQGKLAHSITSGEGVLMELAGEATEYDISGITSYGTGIMYDSVLYAGNEDVVGFNLTFPVPEGFSVIATYTPEGGTATEITPVNGVYSFTMPNANVVINVVTEYLIHNATEWNNFCDALQDNTPYNRFIGKTVKLANDISVTRMAGSDYHDFMGTFDGQGHTLTVAYGSAESPLTEEYAAPFRNLENGAVIHSLHVDGHIYTSNKFASGIVGCQWGTVSVSDCRSSVVIHSSKSGDGTHGGIVAVHHGTLTVSGCVFDGRLLTTNGTTLCAGFVGWRYGTCTLNDCLYAPATDVTMAPGETYITNGATFCRNYSGTLDNCYYTETLSTTQGKLALTDPSVSPVGEPTATYDVSGLTFYGNGVQFGEVFYYETEEAMQMLELVAGSNYVSFYVETTLADLKAALVEALTGTTITIKSRLLNTAYDPNTHRWRGSLNTLDVTQMYMVSVGSGCAITFTGVPVNPAEHPVTISNGTNWIAFPFGGSMSVSDAFAGFAVEGDRVKSRVNNTQYQGGSWRGQLNTLVPGQGYMYISNTQETRIFTFPVSAK